MKDTDHTLCLTKEELEAMLQILATEHAETISCVIRKNEGDKPLRLIAFAVR